MEQVAEEAAQESSCGCLRQVGRIRAQRGQTAREPGKWTQRWYGQKAARKLSQPVAMHDVRALAARSHL